MPGSYISIIMHKGKLLEAWSQKLKEEQENYSTMLEKEMLSVVLWLKSFHTFVIGNNKTDAAIQMLGMDLGQQLDFVCLYGYLRSLSCTIQIQKLIINCQDKTRREGQRVKKQGNVCSHCLLFSCTVYFH